MRLAAPHCPTCHQPAVGTVDLIPAIALFTTIEPDGSVMYCGSTQVDWNGQLPRRGPHQLPLVTCGNHEWESQIDGYDQ